MEKEYKNCPHCGKEILSTAKKCKYCKEWLEELSESGEVNELSDPTPEQSLYSNYSQEEADIIDTSIDKKKRNRFVYIILAVIIIVLIPLCIKFYTDYSKKKAEAEYASWLSTNSCAGLDYRKYSHFKDYVEAVINKKGRLEFKGYYDNKSVTVYLWNKDHKAAISPLGDAVYDEYMEFVGTHKINDEYVCICDSNGVERYRITFGGERPGSLREVTYTKLNSDLGSSTLYRNYGK